MYVRHHTIHSSLQQYYCIFVYSHSPSDFSQVSQVFQLFPLPPPFLIQGWPPSFYTLIYACCMLLCIAPSNAHFLSTISLSPLLHSPLTSHPVRSIVSPASWKELSGIPTQSNLPDLEHSSAPLAFNPRLLRSCYSNL